MRLLWFTNDPMPAALRRFGRTVTGSGHWMPCLLDHLKRRCDLEIEIASACRGVPDDECSEDGVRYYTLGQPRLRSYFIAHRSDVNKCVALVRERRPDLIHIHGTERFYGLLPARGMISTPCVISIQGLLGRCLPAFFGALRPAEIFTSDRLIERLTRRGLLWQYRDFTIGARNERETLAKCDAFMGRTRWDRAQVSAANPLAKYFHVGEILRSQFADVRWDVSTVLRHTVIFTNIGEPWRGTETLIRAMRIVRGEFPGARLRLAGMLRQRSGYHHQLRRKFERAGLSDGVEYLGHLDAAAMARELSRSHVYATASHIENSPNSLCEAMQVGIPCVASYAGGIPSLITDGQSGLLYPVGDAALLAEGIMRIFSDDTLAGRIGGRGRIEASYRHDPARVIHQLLSAYSAVSGHNLSHRFESFPGMGAINLPSMASALEETP